MNINASTEMRVLEPRSPDSQDPYQQAKFHGVCVSAHVSKSMIESFAEITLRDSCTLCKDVKDVRDRKVSGLPILLSKCMSYHPACLEFLMNESCSHTEESQQSDARISRCPSPLYKPEWNGSEFVCKIQKSELDRQAPYVGAPMTFSFDDRPDVTIALGFKGIPWIYCSNPESLGEKKQDLDRLTIVYRNGVCSSTFRCPSDMDKDHYRQLILQTLKLKLSFFLNLTPQLPEGRLKEYMENPQNIPDSFEMYFDTIGDVHAINPPTRPFMWCEPVTQAENVSVAAAQDSRYKYSGCKQPNPEDIVNSTSGVISGKKSCSFPDDDGSAHEAITRWQDEISFKLTVADPDNRTHAQLNGLTFKEGVDGMGIFSCGASVADTKLRETKKYIQFARDFNQIVGAIASDELLTIRIKPEIGAVHEEPQQLFKNFLIHKFENLSPDSEVDQFLAAHLDKCRDSEGEIPEFVINSWCNIIEQCYVAPDSEFSSIDIGL